MIVRSVIIKIFQVGNRKSATYTHRAGPKRQWNEKGIQAILSHYADYVERCLPNEDYKCVPVGPGQFHLVHVGPKR